MSCWLFKNKSITIHGNMNVRFNVQFRRLNVLQSKLSLQLGLPEIQVCHSNADFDSCLMGCDSVQIGQNKPISWRHLLIFFVTTRMAENSRCTSIYTDCSSMMNAHNKHATMLIRQSPLKAEQTIVTNNLIYLMMPESS